MVLKYNCNLQLILKLKYNLITSAYNLNELVPPGIQAQLAILPFCLRDICSHTVSISGCHSPRRVTVYQ